MGFGKEMEGCGSMMKYLLFFSNFVILVGGLIAIGIGIWTIVDKAFVSELLGTNLFMGAVYILIATGVVVSLVAFFGCLGAVKEIKCLLLLYFIIVFIIFITMLVGGILGYVFKEKVRYTMETEMFNSIKYYGQRREITKSWDLTQETLRCCGVTSSSDWISAGGVPESCCRLISDGRGSYSRDRLPCRSFQTPDNTYTRGCLNVAVNFVQDHATVIGGAGIGIALLMLLGMVFSCALFMKIE